MSDSPQLGLLVPLNREGNWSDLLAALIETDPAPMRSTLGLGNVGDLCVSRERNVLRHADTPDTSDKDQIDLVISAVATNEVLALIEVKVLAALGDSQLERYSNSLPTNCKRLLQLKQFEVQPRTAGWESLTWEVVLQAYSKSHDPWVATTARAWQKQIDAVVPKVDGSTVWGSALEEADGEIGLRARVAWLHARMSTWCKLPYAFELSSRGQSWIVTMRAATPVPGYTVQIEIEESMDIAERYTSKQLLGPTVLIGLVQHNVENPYHFDWKLLKEAFKACVLNESGVPIDSREWRTGTAQRSGLPGWITHIKDDPNVPNWLGQGYDMSKKWGYCHFGARFNLKSTLTLTEIDAELRKTECLVNELAASIARIAAASSPPSQRVSPQR